MADFRLFEALYLQNGLRFWPLVFCVWFVVILSRFWPSFMKIFQVVVEILTENHSKKCMKIGHLRAIFSPWRWRVGKNLMRRTGKRIYRRFWISNQIFDSIYGSRDMALSLDTTFGIFGQNLNFVDEYLENQIFAGHAVFARLSELISSTFWPSFIQILNVVFEKKSKNRQFDHIFALYGWSRFFLQNRASSHFLL